MCTGIENLKTEGKRRVHHSRLRWNLGTKDISRNRWFRQSL